jgi:hypothetical protein
LEEVDDDDEDEDELIDLQGDNVAYTANQS